MVQHGTDPDYIEDTELLHQQDQDPSDDDGRCGTCICSQHNRQSSYMSSSGTLDDVSEEADDDPGSSSCSPSCDCQHSSSSTCHSPVHTPVQKESTLNRKGSGRREPFFLHPRKEMMMAMPPTSTGDPGGFFLVPESHIQNDVIPRHHHHHRHHREHHHHHHRQHQQQPFYLHDPKAVVYTRVRELFIQGQPHHLIETEVKSRADPPMPMPVSSSSGTSDLTSRSETSETESDSASVSNEDDHNNNLVIESDERPGCTSASSSSGLPDNEYEEIYSVPSSNPRTIRRDKSAKHPIYEDADESDLISIPPPPGNNFKKLLVCNFTDYLIFLPNRILRISSGCFWQLWPH